MGLKNYRAVCGPGGCDFVSVAAADPTCIPDRNPYGARPEGVYRMPNGVLCLKCDKCGEPKHAVPVDVPR